MSFRAGIQRRPLLVAAAVVGVVKICEAVADSTPVLIPDSGAFISNALGIGFVSFRSYVYGWVIRLVSVPFQSLTALVIFQVLLGGVTAWLVALTLRRHFAVRPSIAIGAAVLFAVDPMQVVHERMVMAEAPAMVVIAVLLLASLEYLGSRKWFWLAAVAVLGITLVALRVAHLPAVLVWAIALPVVPHVKPYWHTRSTRHLRTALIALVVSGIATFACHTAYRQLTGYLGHTEPVYTDWQGLFAVATVAPLLTPEDTNVSFVAELIVDQEASATPLSQAGLRSSQMWEREGFVQRLIRDYGGDSHAASREGQRLFRRAVSRDPVGYLRMAARNYALYWRDLQQVAAILRHESGLGPRPFVTAQDAAMVAAAFSLDTRSLHEVESPARRYYLFGRWWCVVLLTVPFLALAAVFGVREGEALAVGLLAVWSWLVMLEISFGSLQTEYRYLHPLSFIGAIAIGLLLERCVGSSRIAMTPSSVGRELFNAFANGGVPTRNLEGRTNSENISFSKCGVTPNA